jgi:phosphatidylglycerophosphate synthase
MIGARAGAPILVGPRRGALSATCAVGAAVVCTLAALPFAGAAAPLAGLALFGVIGAVVIDRLAGRHPHPRFGIANGITLFRAGGAAVFMALAFEPGMLAGVSAWWALAGAAFLLALDGLDGWAARRQGLISAVGARFDLEIDTLLILALAGLAVGLGKAGPWVLGLGLLRYVFVFAGWLVPALARPLPPSRRRRAVCVLQVAVLAVILAPPIAPPLSAILAAAAFAALVWSFAVDVAWLLRAA